jgi:CBS domain-containing protein
MRAKDIMSSPVVTVTEDTPLKRVVALLLDHDISAVPVVDATGGIVGVVSETDLLSLEAEAATGQHRLLKGYPVQSNIPTMAGHIMTRDVVAVDEEADVSHIARVILDGRLKHIPVVLGKDVVGIVSRRDLLKALARSDLEIRIELEELLDDEILMLERFRAEVENGLVTLRGPRDPTSRQLAKLLTKSVPGVIAVRFAEPAGQPVKLAAGDS